jgi:hypothetical protein
MRVSSSVFAGRRRRLAILASAGLAGATIPAVLAASPALAADSPTCTSTATTVTCTFAYDTNGYAWTVPAGVTTLNVTADGGSGQGRAGGAGGAGAEFMATLTGAAGQTLGVTTGGAGNGRTGGTNGGGNGGTAIGPGGGGGGQTVVTSGLNILVVAGGGGGGGVLNAGGAAGTSSSTVPAATTGGNGSNAASPVETGGKGGNTLTSTGGAAGNALLCTAGTAGTSLQGGRGANCPLTGGGGGGGGYFGGGGGGGSSGGGGGSSYPSAAVTAGGITVTPVTSTGSNTGNGEVIITYARVTTSTTIATSGSPTNPGQPVTFTATVSPTDGGGTVDFENDGTTIPGCGAEPLTQQSGSTYTAMCTTSTLPVGVNPITATYSGDTSYLGSESDPVDQDVVIAAPTRLRAFGVVDSHGNMVVSAQLTSNGHPVSGQLISFTTVLASMPVCTATTNGLGIAACPATGEAAVLIALGQGAFTASYAGTVNYRPAHALGIINGH